MKRTLYLLGILLIVGVLLAACGSSGTSQQGAQAVKTVVVTVQAKGGNTPSGYGATLKAVKARGHLICGVNSELPGFGYVDSQGNYKGFDVDFCHAVAAAIFGDPNKVEFRPLTAKERFTALQTGEIDVLIRNTTWTLTRDTELGANFAATTFYDGQGIMVRKDSGIKKLEDLQGAKICVATGTTTGIRGIAITGDQSTTATGAVCVDGTVGVVTTHRTGVDGEVSSVTGGVCEPHVVIEAARTRTTRLGGFRTGGHISGVEGIGAFGDRDRHGALVAGGTSTLVICNDGDDHVVVTESDRIQRSPTEAAGGSVEVDRTRLAGAVVADADQVTTSHGVVKRGPYHQRGTRR